jgi:hypothetical protein
MIREATKKAQDTIALGEGEYQPKINDAVFICHPSNLVRRIRAIANDGKVYVIAGGIYNDQPTLKDIRDCVYIGRYKRRWWFPWLWKFIPRPG